MNDKPTGLEQMLEQATAPSDSPDRDNVLLTLRVRNGRHAERDEYREAWLAFGQLLEAAQPAPAPLGTVPIFVSAKMGLSPLAPSRRWPLAVAAALAASLLVGLSAYWLWSGADRPGGAQSTGLNMAATKDVKPAAPTAGDLRWDDSLDQQIADAGQGVALAQSELAHAFDATDFARDRLRQTEQDFEKSKL
jgi:hypothetical protein